MHRARPPCSGSTRSQSGYLPSNLVRCLVTSRPIARLYTGVLLMCPKTSFNVVILRKEIHVRRNISSLEPCTSSMIRLVSVVVSLTGSLSHPVGTDAVLRGLRHALRHDLLWMKNDLVLGAFPLSHHLLSTTVRGVFARAKLMLEVVVLTSRNRPCKCTALSTEGLSIMCLIS